MKRHQAAYAVIAAAAAVTTAAISATTIAQANETDRIRQALVAHPEIVMAALQEDRADADRQQADQLAATAAPLAKARAADSLSPSWMGKADGASVVEFYDINCPHCKAFDTQTMLPMLKSKTPIRFTLVDIAILGPGSTRLAQMEAAAGLQGRDRFLRAHVFLMGQHAATPEAADALSQKLVSAAGLDPAAYRKAMTDGSAARIVQINHDQAVAAGIHGTPTVWGAGGVVQGETTTDRVLGLAKLPARG